LKLYAAGISISALWNNKAKLWINGRNEFPVSNNSSSNTIWMHCASLGEFEQGRPLIEKIKNEYPSYKIIITFFSPSGYEMQKNFTGADEAFYLPVDSSKNAKRFIELIKPDLVLWIKYEFWYYYLHELKFRNIPVLLISGAFRKNQPFFKWYGNFWQKMLNCFEHIFVQNQISKTLLESINIKRVTVSGDTRFDRVITIADEFIDVKMIKEFCLNHKVIVAGSTWKEDEAVFVHFVKTNPQIKFIIAPHEIGKENLKDVKKQFTGSIFYSELKNVNSETSDVKNDTSNVSPLTSHDKNCLIIDNIGMLSRLYKYADITYVGGGFSDGGLHNILEAAVYGKPVIFGPEYERNFEADELIECGGGISIENALELETALNNLLKDETELNQRSEAAKNYVYSKAGATEKVMNYIQEKRLLTN
jgi:3-deoxy-D-manno-octulosonic-acid transferase